MFSFNVRWVPGKTHLIADALSRAPLFSPEEMPGLEIDTAISCLSQTSQPLIDIIYNAVDDDYRQLLQDVINNTSISNYSQNLKGSFDSGQFSAARLSANCVAFVGCQACASPFTCEPFWYH